MKVLHVYRTYFPDTQGGLEEAIRQLCAATTALGVENRIFTLSPAPEPSVLPGDEATVFRFPRTLEVASCSMSLHCLAGFRRLVGWADIVHYHFPWPFADLLHAAARVRTPALVTYHADIIRQQGWLLRLYWPLMRWFLGRMGAVVATSPQYAATSPVLPRYRHKLHSIPLGLNPASYPHPDSGELALVRERYGVGYMLFVGVLRYYKGLDILLEASRDAPFTVVIAGSGPLEEELHRKARQWGLANVHFPGHVTDAVKVALYQHARAVVLPSPVRSEAFGVTLLEGAMFAKPLISADIGSGMSLINLHRQTGLVVPPNQAAALRRAMATLHDDAAFAERLGSGAYRRFRERFTAAKMGAAYAHLYRQLLADGGQEREK